MAGEMGYYQPQNYTYGGGGPTQNFVGTAANIVGNAFIPGLGMLTGPIGKFITQMVQQGGGMEDAPDSGGGVPSPATGGYFASRGPAIHFSAGGVPAPGGWGGNFGAGSTGDTGTSGMNFWGAIANRAFARGDPLMGLGGNNAITQYASNLKGTGAAAPAWSTIAPYVQPNKGIIGGSDVSFGPIGKQMSAK